MKKFGTRKKKTAHPGREIVTEPVRRSILDIIETNLRIANRISFVHRLLYIGQHHLDSKKSIVEIMEHNYKQSNTGYYTEPLSGILLYYPQFFCYIVEGSESILNKHMSLLFEQMGEEETLFNIKLLSAVHDVKGRFWNEWMSYYGRPAQRVEEIDPESDLENSMRYVKECCEKLYNFANAFITDQLKLRSKYLEEQAGKAEDEGEGEPTASSSFEIPFAIIPKTKSIAERDPYSDHLPEIKLLDFLVHCKHCKDLKQYQKYYQYIGQSEDYSLKVWPAPKAIIPYDVFDKPYQPIEDLPSGVELAGQEVEEIKEEEGELLETESVSSKQE